MRMVSPATSRSTAAREKLTLQNGVPVTIALEYGNGKRVPSRIPGAPDQVYYSLDDGRGWYADLGVAEMIEQLDLVSGEPFIVCKYGRDWEVKRAVERPALRAAAAPPPPTPPTPPPPRPAAPVNAQGETAAEILAACYPDAVTVALAGVAAAKAAGLMVAPTFEDIRCIATTLFIQRNGGRS